MGSLNAFNTRLLITIFVGIILISLQGCNSRFHKEKLAAKKSSTLGKKLGLGLGTQEGEKLQVYMVSTTWCSSCEEERAELKNYFESHEKEESFQEFLEYVDIISLFYDPEDEELDRLKAEIPWKIEKDKDAPNSLAENECPELSFPCLLIHHPERGFVYKHNGNLGVDNLMKKISEYL